MNACGFGKTQRDSQCPLGAFVRPERGGKEFKNGNVEFGLPRTSIRCSPQLSPDPAFACGFGGAGLSEEAMKYLCLIYDDEKKWETMSKAEADAYMGEYFQFTDVQDQRRTTRAASASARADGHDDAVAEREAVNDRRTVR